MPEPARSTATSAAPGADGLLSLRDVAEEPSIERAVEAVREFLGMEIAYTTELTASKQVFRHVQGDGESFGIATGGTMPLEETYCRRVLAGRLPNITPDVKKDPRASRLAITTDADVGAFVSVPLRLSDGSVPGTLCAASHEAMPELGYRELQFLKVLARMIADQMERQALEARQRKLELQAASAEALLAAIAERDAYTGEHSRCVVSRAGAVARLLGLGEEEVEDVKRVALLHDVGKLGIPDSILHKPGSLDPEEWDVMRRHPIVGERLIAKVPGLDHLAPALRAEHERWDGGGYPDGLYGDEIPIASRITFVCDAYDAMTSDRPYRPALPVETARAEIRAGAGSQFCPRSAAALLAVLEGPTDRP